MDYQGAADSARRRRALYTKEVELTISNPYWWEGLAAFEADSLPPSADVVVAGAGICGLAAAIELSRCNRSVVLVDSQQIGYGASSRNMGLLSGVAKESEACFLQLLDDAKADCDIEKGALLLASTARNLRDLAASIPRRKQEYGLDDYVVTRDQLREHIGGAADREFAGALVMPNAIHLHPGKMVLALAKYAQSLGVQVCENSRVLNWEVDAKGLTVDCDGHALQAMQLLLTTGGYTGQLSRPLWKRTLSIPSTAAVSDELPAAMIDELFPTRSLAIINRFRGLNCRPTPDGRRIVLAGPVADAPQTTAGDLKNLKAHFKRLFPTLEGIEFTHCWTGYAGVARDRRTHIGKQDGAWYSIGASGLVYSAEAGRRAAGQIVSDMDGSDEGFTVWPLRGHRKLLWKGIEMTARTLDAVRCSRQR
jgi:glycine/D-amino acid oxidase-like deaminating enzyme